MDWQCFKITNEIQIIFYLNMAQNPNFESRCKPKTAKETDQYFNKQNLKSDKDTNDPFDNIMKFDQDGELIIEFEDSIFNIEEEQLSTPIEDDFEYEILVDDNSSQRYWLITSFDQLDLFEAKFLLGIKICNFLKILKNSIIFFN